MFKFRNIDGFAPGRFERMGMLKGKRWYTNTQDTDELTGNTLVLFKPKRKEFGDKKVFCANHYGEFVGYLLAIGSKTPACKVELAKLSKYYENIHKEKNNGTPEPKDGCISYSHLERNQLLEHGKIVVDNYVRDDADLFFMPSKSYENKISVTMAAIEKTIREFYRKSSFKRSSEYIDTKVSETRKRVIDMIIYDCLYGNNDRHDENWALVKDQEGRDIDLYPIYDNERVLGLYENIKVIENSLLKGTVEEDSEKILFSRMTVPNETERSSSYKEVLKYMISEYPETQEILEKHLNSNPPMKVRMYLEACEDLPRTYIDFGFKMYEGRYNFARELAKKHKENQNRDEEKDLQEEQVSLDNR